VAIQIKFQLVIAFGERKLAAGGQRQHRLTGSAERPVFDQPQPGDSVPFDTP
jgi:hypothetical protein